MTRKSILLFITCVTLVAANAAAYTYVGDVNSDGEVGIADVTSLVSIVLSGEESSNVLADVNQDGEIGIADVTALINYILTNEAPRYVALDDSAVTENAEEIPDDDEDPFFNDYIENAPFTSTVTITYDGNTASFTGKPNGVTISVDGAHVTVISATKNVKYVLKGSTDNGSFKIYSEKKFCLTLNGVSITNPTGAAINNQCGKTFYVVLPEGTTNYLADGPTYTEVEQEDQKAALFSEGQTIFSGKGALTVYATGKSGITCDDYIRFRPGPHITVTSTANHGVKANDGIYINGGVLNITVTTDAVKGINCGGLCEITGGRTTVITTGAPIIATTEVGNDTTSCAALKADTALVITGGILNLKATGDGGKGINCNSTITKTGGDVTVVAVGPKITAAPKGVKCDLTMTVSGGKFYTYSARSKPLDVDGGITVANGYTTYKTLDHTVQIDY